MADRRDEKKEEKGNQLQRLPGRKHMSESSPNPHGESKILEMPIRTQQRNETRGKNIPQTPNTIGGKLNPSVVHDFGAQTPSDRDASARRTRTLKPGKEPDKKIKDA